MHQTKITLPPISCIFLLLLDVARVEKDALQRPVERPQVLTTPASSTEIAILSFVCKLIVMDGGEVDDGSFLSDTSSPVGEAPICQNLIDSSDEMKQRRMRMK